MAPVQAPDRVAFGSERMSAATLLTLRLPELTEHRILAPMLGSLNILQRSMLQWNDLHPYNAVHVVRIPGAPNLGRLRLVINGTLEAYGVTNLELNRKRGAYRYHGGAADCEIRVLSKEDASRSPLSAEIGRQLNTGFVPGERMNPFRFFVDAAGDFFSLGLVYFHPVADAEAVVRLLMHIVNAYAGPPDPGLSDGVDLYPRRHDRLFRQHPVLLARKLAALRSIVGAMRRSSRPRCRDAQDLRNSFTSCSLASDDFHLLADTSRKLGVTLHDLFLALLMKALSPLAATRAQARRRRNISVGSIVNLRKDLGLDHPRSFGLCLGSFVVTHRVPDEMTVRDLARDIRQQTLQIKRRKLYSGTPLDLALGRVMLGLFSTEQRKKLYPKHYPLWGGITNMNLNPIWKQPDGAGPADYFRAVSTGPVTPLVLSITTVRDVVNLGITYRTAVYQTTEIEQVRQHLLDTIHTLEARA